MANGEDLDYTSGQSFAVGDRVELSPATDLWMRGAKYGTVSEVTWDNRVAIRMDHKSVRRLQWHIAENVRHIR